MDDSNVRAGIQQAKAAQTGLNILGVEAIIIAGIIGVGTQSWAAGIFTFLGVFVLFSIVARSEAAANFIAAVVGGIWMIACYFLAAALEAGPALAAAIAMLVGMLVVGSHMLGFQHLRDLSRAKG